MEPEGRGRPERQAPASDPQSCARSVGQCARRTLAILQGRGRRDRTAPEQLAPICLDYRARHIRCLSIDGAGDRQFGRVGIGEQKKTLRAVVHIAARCRRPSVQNDQGHPVVQNGKTQEFIVVRARNSGKRPIHVARVEFVSARTSHAENLFWLQMPNTIPSEEVQSQPALQGQFSTGLDSPTLLQQSSSRPG
jgi:hypothetical protein